MPDPVSILGRSCSSFIYVCVYIIIAGSGPGKGFGAIGLSTPGPRLHFFFKVLYFVSCFRWMIEDPGL